MRKVANLDDRSEKLLTMQKRETGIWKRGQTHLENGGQGRKVQRQWPKFTNEQRESERGGIKRYWRKGRGLALLVIKPHSKPMQIQNHGTETGKWI